MKGIIPRAITEIFEYISSAAEDVEFIVKMSVVEVYKEQIRDLIELKDNVKIEIREDVHGSTYMEGVEESYVGSELEVSEKMLNALGNRRVGRTNMNEVSSRSHVVTVFHIEQNIKSQSKVLKGKLFLVDLAGSECLDKTGATGERMDEAKFINKGLLTIGRVINALTENQPFIPYRDSKLTRILKESLGGNSRTTLVITASPSIYNEVETTSTLRFGARAKLIKNKPVVNMELSKEQMVKLIDQKNQRIIYLEGYTKFLENHIVHVLKQPLPVYNPTGELQNYEDPASLNSTTNTKISDQNESEKLYSGQTSAQAAEMKEKIMDCEDRIRSLEEAETESKQKFKELMNKNSQLETKLKILKEQSNISNSKIVTLVQTLKMIEDEFKIVDEKNIELENQNNELVNMVEELEATLEQQSSTPLNILEFLDGPGMKSKESGLDFDSIMKNTTSSSTSIHNTELTKLLEVLKAKSNENDLIKQRNNEMQTILKELMNSYKTLVEKEIPELDIEHKAVISNLKKIEAKNDFVFNDKIMSIVNDYLNKNSQLENELVFKTKLIEDLNKDLSQLRKDCHEKMGASQMKMKVLVSCIYSLAKYTEEIMINNLSQAKSKLEVNLNQNDLYSSMMNPGNLQKSMFEGNKSKIIKVIKGESKRV